MKKLIITIFIIFSTLQAFAVLPPMFRYAYWFNDGNYINIFESYEHPTTNVISWWIASNHYEFNIIIGGNTLSVNLKNIMQDALEEWKGAFREPGRPNPTILRDSTVTNTPIRVSINTQEALNDTASITVNYRGAFEYNQKFGNVVFNKEYIENLLKNPTYINKIKEATGNPNMSIQNVFSYIVKVYAKQAVGFLLGVANVYPITHLPELTTPLNRLDLSNLARVVYMHHIIEIAVPVDGPVPIMVGNVANYFRYLHAQLGRPVTLNDINVTAGDIGVARAENRCVLPPNTPKQIGYSFALNCNTAEIKAIVTSYLANNTARTTAVVTYK